MASLPLPQAAPKWTHTTEEISQLTKAVIDADRERQDRVAALSPKDCTFESVFVRPHLENNMIQSDRYLRCPGGA